MELGGTSGRSREPGKEIEYSRARVGMLTI